MVEVLFKLSIKKMYKLNLQIIPRVDEHIKFNNSKYLVAEVQHDFSDKKHIVEIKTYEYLSVIKVLRNE